MNTCLKNNKSYKPYKPYKEHNKNYNKNYKLKKKEDYAGCKKYVYSKDEVNLKQMVFLMIIIMNV